MPRHLVLFVFIEGSYGIVVAQKGNEFPVMVGRYHGHVRKRDEEGRTFGDLRRADLGG